MTSSDVKTNNLKDNINVKDKEGKESTLNNDKSAYPNVGICKLLFTLADGIDILYITLAIIGAVGTGVCLPIFALIFGDSINKFGTSNNSDISIVIKDVSLQLIWVGLGTLFATAINNTFANLSLLRYSKKIKQEYFKALLRQEQGFYDQKNAFEFSTKVQAQIKMIDAGLGSKITNTIMALSMFIASYIVGFIVSWKLSLILVTTVPFIILSSYMMIISLMTSQSKTRKYFEEAGGIAEEILYNIKTVASFSNYDYERERFNHKVTESYENGKYGGILSSLSRGLVFFMIFVGYAIAIGVGGKFIADKESNGTSGKPILVGDVFTIIFTIVVGALTLGKAAPNLQAISSACEASREFFYIYERIPEIDLTESVEKPNRESLSGRVEFKNVSFAYPSKKDRMILQNLNINFEPGTSTAIVGETGSGKSTIVNLLERLYDVESGSIEIDGINVKKMDINYFRSLIGYVQQEPVLFNNSIKDNIIFGRDNVTEDEIKEACEKAIVNEFLPRLDKGIDSKVGVKGSKLSGGQKQRVAIARAILKKPKLLFLDEATSALDNKSEVLVKQALDSVSKGVTTIIIAHRLSTVRNADKIIVLNKGCIEEIGNHEELFEKRGLYYNLVKNQEQDEPKKQEVPEETEETNRIKVDEIKKQESLVSFNSIKRGNSRLSFKDVPEDELNMEQRKLKFQEEQKEKDIKIKLAKGILWPILCENPGTLIVATIMASLSGSLFPVYGYLQAESIFQLSSSPINPLTPDDIKHNASVLAGVFVALATALAIVNFFVGNLFTLMGEHLAMSMRKKVFNKYLELHMGFFDISDNSPGTLLTKLASDTIKINGVALSMFAVLVETVVTLLTGCGIAFAFSWQLSLITLAFVPFIIISSVLRFRLERGFAVTDEIKEKDLGNLLSECVVNTKTIYCFNMQGKASSMYKELSEVGEHLSCLM